MKCGFNQNLFPINQLESRSVGCSIPGKAKIVNVNFHFINRTNGTGNFTASGNKNGSYNGYQFAADLLNTANYLLANNHQLYQPIGNNTPIQPLNIQLVSKGVYFWNNDALFNNDAYNQGFGIYDSYVVGGTTTINIFFSGGIPPDNYDGVTNFNLNKLVIYKIDLWNHQTDSKVHPELTTIKMTHFFFADVMVHELGHIFSLNHPFSTSCNLTSNPDNCSDTKTLCQNTMCFQPLPPLKNPYDNSQCTDPNNYTNTFMDYSINWKAYSPCQISTMNSDLQSILGSYYGCLTSDYNLKYNSSPINGIIYTSGCSNNTVTGVTIDVLITPCTTFTITITGPIGTKSKTFNYSYPVTIDLGTIYKHIASNYSEPLAVGNYGVTLTTNAGYASSSNSSSFQIKYPTYCGYNLSIAPNPASNSTTISFDVDKGNENLGLLIYEKTKKLKVKDVFLKKYHDKGHYSISVDISDIPTGTYVVELDTPAGPVTQTFQIFK